MSEKAELQFVKLMIEDPNTYVAYHKWFDPSYFNNAGVKTIINAMNEFYKEKQFPANYDNIRYQIERTVKAEKKMDAARLIFKEIRDRTTLDGAAALKDYGLEYIKKKAITSVCNKLIGDFDKKAFNDGMVSDAVSEIVDINKANKNECRVIGGEELLNMMGSVDEASRIRFGIKEIDDHINGLPKRTVNMVIAPTGVGKTTFLSICAIYAAMQGYRVAHFFFEDSEADIASKYFAAVTGRDSKSFINNMPLVNEALNASEDLKDAILSNLKQVKLKVGLSTVEDIEKKIWEMMNGGFIPDFVVIDYMGCLQLSSNKVMAIEKEWQLLEREMKKLEAMANEMDICIFTAQQTNRDGSKEDTANNRIGNVQGSFRMLQPCSYVFYLTKVNDGTDYNKANLYLDKSRGCAKRAWENIYFNNGTCQMDLSGAVVNDSPMPFEYNDDEYHGMKIIR